MDLVSPTTSLATNSPHKTWSHNWTLIYILWNECLFLSARLPVSWCRNFYPLHSWYTVVSPQDCLFLSLVLSQAGFTIATFHSACKVASMSQEKGMIFRCKQECSRGISQHRSTELSETPLTPQGPVGASAVGIRQCEISLLSSLLTSSEPPTNEGMACHGWT